MEYRLSLEVFQEQIIPKPVTVTDYSTDMTMPWDSIFPVLFCFLSVVFFLFPSFLSVLLLVVSTTTY